MHDAMLASWWRPSPPSTLQVYARGDEMIGAVSGRGCDSPPNLRFAITNN